MNKNLKIHMGNCNHRAYIPKLVEMVVLELSSRRASSPMRARWWARLRLTKISIGAKQAGSFPVERQSGITYRGYDNDAVYAEAAHSILKFDRGKASRFCVTRMPIEEQNLGDSPGRRQLESRTGAVGGESSSPRFSSVQARARVPTLYLFTSPSPLLLMAKRNRRIPSSVRSIACARYP